jgi:hypothetical protein
VARTRARPIPADRDWVAGFPSVECTAGLARNCLSVSRVDARGRRRVAYRALPRGALGLQSGILSDWTNYDYLGSPLLGFTGSLVFVVGGAMDLLFRDANLTAKVYLLVCHLATGWLFYLFIRRLGLSRASALAGALSYGGSLAHLHLLIFRGALPPGITMAALILLFTSAEGVMQRRATCGPTSSSSPSRLRRYYSIINRTRCSPRSI